VLGLRAASTVVRELREVSGAPVFEIPTPPPSVPGMRLYDILAEAFQRAGGRVQIGAWVLRGESEGRQLRAIYTEAAAREQRHTASQYLLATGGIAGGGLRTNHTGAIVETALGLPVTAPAHRANWFAPRFLAPEGHAIYRAGIGASDTLRPLDSQGAVVYENVVVAGAALAGADLIHEGAYEGVALATGWRAAGELLGAAHGTQTAEAAGLPATDH
jgi:glycerol-3-phosphate dehydrogenase subunit B